MLGTLIRKEFSAKQQVGQPSEEDLALINKLFAMEPVTAADIYVVATALANTRVDRSLEEFPVAYLERFAETITGKSFITGHDTSRAPDGLVFSASVARADDGHHELMTKAYLGSDDPLVPKIRRGIARYVSISGSVDALNCKLCGKSYRPQPGDAEPCKHQVGEAYEGQLCTLVYGGDTRKVEAHEQSMVYLGCQRGAEVVAAGSPAGIRKHFLPGGALILNPPSPNTEHPIPNTEPKGAAMTIEEAQARISDLEKELAALKQPDPLVEVGKAYKADLATEIKAVAKKVGDECLTDYETFFTEIPDPSLDTLKKWREGVQKRFDAKFPPQAQGKQRSESEREGGTGKQIAVRPTVGGRW